MDRFKFKAALLVAATSACALVSAQAASAATDICIAANGEVQVQKGTATCEAAGQGSVAIAKGEGSLAVANAGNHNTAKALGEGSTAFAQGGDHNTATASGDGSQAHIFGTNNTAIASGDSSIVILQAGNNNTGIREGRCQPSLCRTRRQQHRDRELVWAASPSRVRATTIARPRTQTVASLSQWATT